jgi:Ca2+:H+ antiporter
MIIISDLLVGSIMPFVEETGISQVFIGLILVPIFGNVVDHIVAITVALKNKMDLSLTISVGSAAQVACLVLPSVVLVGYMMGQPEGMVFAPIELIALALGLLFMVPVLLDGFSNWLEGVQLLTCYVILAAVLWA